MQCVRCGATFEGAFCPVCGTPAAPPALSVTPGYAPPPGYAPAPGYPSAPSIRFQCGRCGTVYEGRFCPTCGYPAWGVWMPPMGPPPTPVLYPILNVAWILALAGFFAVLAIAIAGMAVALPQIAGGIGEIRRGTTTDGTFDTGPGAWTFHPWTAIGATGSTPATGGDPGGYATIELEGRDGAITSGYWVQSFNTSGSFPYLAAVVFDYRVEQASTILENVTVSVYVDTSSGPPTLGRDLWSVTLTTAMAWTPATSVYPPTGETIAAVDASSVVRVDGTYYVKVAALAWNRGGAGAGTPTIVGLDNLALRWATNAYVDFVVIAPIPIELYFTQDPTVFAAWTAVLATSVVASLAILALKDTRKLRSGLLAPAKHVSAKLRSRSAWVAVAQTFLAVVFLNIVIGILTETPEPAFYQEVPGWYLLYLLLNASVYEEIIFRVLIIGLPLLVGSLYCRAANVVKRRAPAGVSGGRYVLGSLRYLYGGGLSRATSPAILLPGSLLLLASSVVFGLAHAPGYGDWKVLPAAVAGLAMGYLYLRHGLPAAILFHFAVDMFVAAASIVGFESDAGILISLLYLFLAAPGAGFFAYYFLYIARFIRDVLIPPGTRTPARGLPGAPAAVAAAALATAPPAPPGYAVPPGYAAPPANPPPTMGSTLPPGYVPSSRPPMYGTAPVQYRCPRCGWVEAVYEAGGFKCARCGYVS